MTLIMFGRRQWHPTPVLLPGKSHGWRILVGYSPWGLKELDRTEWLTEKAMATHSRTLAWKIPWTGEPGRLQSMGSLRVGHDWSNLAAAAVAKLCLILFDPMDCSMPGSPVLHISRSLRRFMSVEWVMPSNRLILCSPFSFYEYMYLLLLLKENHVIGP